MSYTGTYKIFSICRNDLLRFQLNFPRNNYAKKDTGAVSMLGGTLKKKKLGKLGPTMEKTILPVETDPQKLVKFVCGSNIYTTGQDVEIKPDSEYPEWLWSLNLGPAPTLEELNPNSKEYWKKIRRMALKQNNVLSKIKKL